MEWMVLPLKRYGVFEGRSGRREFWMYTAFLTVIYTVIYAGIVMSFMPFDRPRSAPFPPTLAIWMGVFVVLYWATFLPALALQVRRLHDQNQTGWLVLLAFIPYLGWLVMLVFMSLEGTRGPNRFGPDPRDPDGGDQVQPAAAAPPVSAPLPRRPDLA